MKQFTPTIGLEIHAELKTKTKMFCHSANKPHDEKANTHVCPVCMGHPGTLPFPNKEAIRHVLRVGVALDGKIASFTEFDRKNYFYPDIPKGYQISQYKYPLVTGGTLCGIAVTRVHLEEDTARSLHDRGGESIIDYNRAGVPLMELVTEPVIHDAKTATDFARELQLLLRTLGASDANMEKGEMRVEANISISDTEQLGTKVEVKNLNSFRSVENAIIYEVKRQEELLKNGLNIDQETRGWDENSLKTYSQRQKETAHDYRYFPEPDIPKLNLEMIEEFSLSRLGHDMPELPSEKRKKYSNIGLTREQVEIIIASLETDAFFSRLLENIGENPALAKMSANYLISDLLPVPEKYSLQNANPEHFTKLMQMVSGGQINSRVAKDILFEVVFESQDPAKLVEEKNLGQQSSEDELLKLVEEVISLHPEVVQEYQAGKEGALQYLIGQCMKQSGGSANPKVLQDLLKRELG